MLDEHVRDRPDVSYIRLPLTDDEMAAASAACQTFLAAYLPEDWPLTSSLVEEVLAALPRSQACAFAQS
jgi:hypothetical protein